MSTSSAVTSRFQELSERLQQHEQQLPARQTRDIARLWGIDKHWVRYLGLGKMINTGGTPFALYLRGRAEADGIAGHELHVECLSAPESDFWQRCYPLGHVSIRMWTPDKFDVSAHSFDNEIGVPRPPLETLLAPLGSWAVDGARTDLATKARSLARAVAGETSNIEFSQTIVDPTDEGLAAIRELCSTADSDLYFTFGPGNGLATRTIPTAPLVVA
ncbi:MAG TPA: hypothetical protein VLF91_04045 [Candidatus Saccharimonadales bacterium]|nr:hypothetical protein [Candidatus Saccharimonadales bacterium]